MRLLKRADRVDPPEDEAAAVRLQAVTQRGKEETSRYPSRDDHVTSPPPRGRLFRTSRGPAEDNREQ